MNNSFFIGRRHSIFTRRKTHTFQRSTFTPLHKTPRLFFWGRPPLLLRRTILPFWGWFGVLICIVVVNSPHFPSLCRPAPNHVPVFCSFPLLLLFLKQAPRRPNLIVRPIFSNNLFPSPLFMVLGSCLDGFASIRSTPFPGNNAFCYS